MSDMESTDFKTMSQLSEDITELPEVKAITEMDKRIKCTNHEDLDKILAIALSKVTAFADRANLPDSSKTVFISTFHETFKTIIYKNVTVNGLPWAINKEQMTEANKKEQKTDNNNAIRSSISSELEVIANKRKTLPRECRRIQKLTVQKESMNLKKKPVCVEGIATTSLPATKNNVLEDSLHRMATQLPSLKTDIDLQTEELQTTLQNAEYAFKLRKRQERLLDDTGYESD